MYTYFQAACMHMVIISREPTQCYVKVILSGYGQRERKHSHGAASPDVILALNQGRVKLMWKRLESHREPNPAT